MSDFIASTIRALGFLTRISIAPKWFIDNPMVAQDAGAFPLAGTVIGLLGGFIFVITIYLGLPASGAALFSLLAMVLLTGALHEDGLSDVFDGFFARKTATQRLTIMKDSHIGAFGTLALVFIIALRVVLITDLYTRSSLTATFITIIVSEAISRAAMIWHWCALPLARIDGTAAKAGCPDKKSRNIAILTAFLIAAAGIWPSIGFSSFVLSIFLIVLAVFGFQALCRNKIGGYTGDTLGAMQQIATIAFLTGLIIGL